MKAKSIFMILIALCFIKIDAIAQSEKGSIRKDKSKKSQVYGMDNKMLVIDSLKKTILFKDSIACDNLVEIMMLKECIKSDSAKISDFIHKNDSLINEIDIRDKEIKRLAIELENEKGFVDTCMVKLANKWLYEKFDKENVNVAIKYFDRIYSSKLKSDLSIVQELLRDYEKSYKEFQSILRDAQNDIDRTNKFANVEDYKTKYIQRIKGMLYYRKYYGKDWTIRYLDEQIEKTMETLTNHTKDKPADLDFLIDKDVR